MSIAGVTSTTSSSATNVTGTGSSTIGKDDFLKLLVTQLQKQDPLNPQDPTEFTSQLTQFSSLEQLMGVNDNIKNLTLQDSLGGKVTATGFIGKTARVNGDLVSVKSGQAAKVNFSLAGDSAKTSVNIYDVSGKLIDVVDLGKQGTGDHEFQWDAKGKDGTTEPDGAYQFEVVAQNSDGDALSASSSFSGQITGVSFENNQTLLDIGGVKWSLADVTSLSN
jgi:flagellar basal-body rod modification protein FlgD